MPLIIQAAEDKSWRVRLCLSKNFTDIATNFGKEVTDMSLIQTFSNLLKDSEIDVKIEAVKSLSNFVKTVSSERISYLLPQVTALGKDALSIVRGTVLLIQRASAAFSRTCYTRSTRTRPTRMFSPSSRSS
jgi:serine/threonine-protein phosphatase 2A regulatory subunit A